MKDVLSWPEGEASRRNNMITFSTALARLSNSNRRGSCRDSVRRGEFRIADLDVRRVLAAIKFRANLQPRLFARIGNQVDDDFMTDQVPQAIGSGSFLPASRGQRHVGTRLVFAGCAKNCASALLVFVTRGSAFRFRSCCSFYFVPVN